MKSLGFQACSAYESAVDLIHIHDFSCICRLYASAVLNDHLIGSLLIRKVR